MKQMIIGKHVNIIRDTDKNGKDFYWLTVWRYNKNKKRILDYTCKSYNFSELFQIGYITAICRN